MKEIIDLPILGTVRRSAEIAYRVAAPVTPATVGQLVREPWCRRVDVTDAKSNGATGEFRALCVLDGTPFIVSGPIRNP